ncbi:hypothetical protein J1N35_005900, partial [Gossypium stocksii]
MATIGYHTHSNSFPSRAHPLTFEVGEHLSRLASYESASTSSSLNQNQGEYVNELLNGPLGLLDVFTIAKDALLQVKECTVELQYILRRKRGATKGCANE